MNTRKGYDKAITRAAFLVLVLGVLHPAGSQAPAPGYAVTDLGTLGSPHTLAHGINNKGQVVGKSGERAFLWESGKMRGLGTLPGASSSDAHDINDAGLVVGETETQDEESQYFLWQNGKIQPLGLPGTSGRAAINNKGQVVGTSRLHAVLWQNGKTTDMGEGTAIDINDRGQMIGAQSPKDKQGDEDGGSLAAVVWEKGKVTVIGDDEITPRAINNKGIILIATGAANGGRGFLLSGGRKTELGALNGHLMSPLAMNDRRQVVGTLGSAEGDPCAALWQNGRVYDLNRLVPAGSGWVLAVATDINERGQIVGVGRLTKDKRPDDVTRAFLLTPR